MGCSIHCHRDHEILELFNKRNFRCDCGNGKFPDSSKCQLYGAKSDSNTKNKYNHNFKGKYCYCDSDYVEGQDTMAQCIHCEDWFHDRCLSESAVSLPILFTLGRFLISCLLDLDHP